MYNPYPAAVFGVPIALGFLYLPYYTGCTIFLFYFVSAFDFITCSVSCFCARQYTGYILFLFCLVSAFDFIICFVFCFCARQYTGCTLVIFIASAFDFIFGNQMPLHSAFCTCPIILRFVITLRTRAGYICER